MRAGGGLGLDGLVHVLALVRREGHGHSPIKNHVATEGDGHLRAGARDDLGLDLVEGEAEVLS